MVGQIVAYHAEIHVQQGNKVVTLLVDCPDWSPDDEILRDLAVKYGAGTVGEIVAAMRREGKVRAEAVGAENFFLQGDRELYRADQPIP